MSKRKDLTGQRFGKLTAVEYLSVTTHPDLKRGAWKCVCDCGNTTIVPPYELLSGGTKSCGCLRHTPPYEDLKGQTFGKWTVIRRALPEETEHRGQWLCRCRCGTEAFIMPTTLKSGKTKGCKKCAGYLRDKPKNDLSGQQFGKIHVDSWTRKPNPKTGKNEFIYNCTCGCGKKIQSRRPESIRSCGCDRRDTNSTDITGQRFGLLTAVSRADYAVTKSGRKIAQWVFRCDCGNVITRRKDSVINGSIQSCGCKALKEVEQTAEKRYLEESLNTYTKMPIKIVGYNRTGDITVQFPDGVTVEHRSYSSFIRGEIGHPGFKMNSVFHGYRLVKRAFIVNEIPYWYVYPPDSDLMDIMTAMQMIEKSQER